MLIFFFLLLLQTQLNHIFLFYFMFESILASKETGLCQCAGPFTMWLWDQPHCKHSPSSCQRCTLFRNPHEDLTSVPTLKFTYYWSSYKETVTYHYFYPEHCQIFLTSPKTVLKCNKGKWKVASFGLMEVQNLFHWKPTCLFKLFITYCEMQERKIRILSSGVAWEIRIT